MKRRIKKATAFYTALMLMVASLAAICLLGGCNTYKGGSYHDGIAIQMGARIPVSEQIQLTLFNFCTGTVFLFDADAAVTVQTTQTNSVSVLGIYNSATVKGAQVTLSPCEGERNGRPTGSMQLLREAE